MRIRIKTIDQPVTYIPPDLLRLMTKGKKPNSLTLSLLEMQRRIDHFQRLVPDGYQFDEDDPKLDEITNAIKSIWAIEDEWCVPPELSAIQCEDPD